MQCSCSYAHTPRYKVVSIGWCSFVQGTVQRKVYSSCGTLVVSVFMYTHTAEARLPADMGAC